MNAGMIRAPDSPYFEPGVFYRWIVEDDTPPRVARETPERQLLLQAVTRALTATLQTLPTNSAAPLGGEDGDIAQHFLNCFVDHFRSATGIEPVLALVEHDRPVWIGLAADALAAQQTDSNHPERSKDDDDE